jgi:S1-C subfamily serine protease
MGSRTAKILVPALLVPIVVCTALAIVLWIFSPDADDARGAGSSQAPRSSLIQTASAPAASGSSDEAGRIALYERVGPAVVSIDTASSAENAASGDGTVELAQGSGFVVDSDGHIVTNNHVIEGSTAIYVTFADGRQVAAELAGADPDSDLAVIKVDPQELYIRSGDERQAITPIEFADSRQVKVGQDTIAIGNPFGLQNTMTLGIVSAVKGRNLPGRVTGAGGRFQISRIIQTDAAVNPGNSGGPLLDSSGRLIGVNTAIRVSDVSSMPQFAGVAYAVPSNTVRIVVEDLIATGEHKSAYLGVSMYSITPRLAELFDLEVSEGVLLLDIQPNSPAAAAKLQIGTRAVEFAGAELIIDSDIILAFNGEPLLGSDDLIAAINDSRVGDTVTLTIRRGAEERDVQVTLTERPQ